MKLSDLYMSGGFVTVVKGRRLRWVVHAARMDIT
jgi:hypothetical protein